MQQVNLYFSEFIQESHDSNSEHLVSNLKTLLGLNPIINCHLIHHELIDYTVKDSNSAVSDIFSLIDEDEDMSE
jgi:hypothetical protein